MNTPLLDGISLDITPQVVRISSLEPLTCLSSAVVGGGYTRAQEIINLHVDKNYDGPNPAQDLNRYAVQAGIEKPYLGLMTAVFPQEAEWLTLSKNDMHVSAVITAGVNNATAAGLEEPVTRPRQAGTINIILISSTRLSPPAMVNAVMTATEAKSAVLGELGIQTSAHNQATGTSTDAVVMACLDRGPTLSYAGPLTTPGWMIGKAVREILHNQLS